MVSYYKTIDGRISEIEQYESGCWINCVAPEEDEIEATRKKAPILIPRMGIH